MKFRLINKKGIGSHQYFDKDGNSVTVSPGEVLESDKDLVKLFPNKFEYAEPIDDPDATPVVTDVPDFPLRNVKDDTTVVEPPKEGPYGIDVTAEFPKAVEANLTVFEKLKWYTIVDPEDKTILNEKKLRKAKVNSFLEDYLEDTLEEE